jgi:molybdopterin synthase catalytic subunit
MTADRPAMAGLGHLPGTATAEVRAPHGPVTDSPHGSGTHAARDSSRVAPAAHVLALAEVTEAALDLPSHEALVSRRSAGAVVSFGGVVRDHDGGRTVLELEYVAHPSAGAVLAEIAAEFAAMEHVEAVAVSHRIGQLEIGDTALACAVSTAHRAEAFALCGRLVDEVKSRLPIWKRQVFADGTEEWVDCP